LPSLTEQRRKVLPNPGSLDQIQFKDEVTKNLVLIPDLKIRAKTDNNLNFSVSYRKDSDLLIHGEIHQKSSDYNREEEPLIHQKTHENSSIEGDLLKMAA